MSAGQTGNISKGTGQAAVLDHLRAAIPLILKPLCAHLKDKSVKTRQGAVGVVREVALAVPVRHRVSSSCCCYCSLFLGPIVSCLTFFVFFVY